MKFKKKKLLAAMCFICLGTVFAAAGCRDDGGGDDSGNNPGNNPVIEDKPPVISVTDKDTFTAGTYIVGTPVTLPAVTALDPEDDDLTSSVKLRVLFNRDDEYILFDDEEEVKGNTIVTFTPEKCGKYTAIYTVRDKGGNTTREEVSFNVVGDGQEKPHQLLENQENWLTNADTKFDDEGNIVLHNINNSSAAYKEKIHNGDIVQFRMNGTSRTGRFYTFGSILSRSSAADAPVADESTQLAGNLRFLVRKSVVEFWLVRGDEVNINPTQFTYELLDGKDHTVAFRFALQEDGADGSNNALTVQLWLDCSPSTRATYEETFVASEIKEKQGEEKYNKECAKLFDSATFEGYFNAGAQYGDGDFSIKSFGINGEQLVGAPTLSVEFEKDQKYFVGREINFPKAKIAEDGNTYADLSDRVAVKVIRRALGDTPEEEIELEGFEFTPETAGLYRAVYTVTDYSGNKAYAYYDFAVASSEDVAKPTIVLSLNGQILSDTEEDRSFEVKLGETFLLPTAVSAIDGDNLDLIEYVTVSLDGSEAKTLSATEYVFLTVGTHKVVYSVTDTLGNPVKEEITVTVTCDDGKGMLSFNEDNFGGKGLEFEYSEEKGGVAETIKLLDDDCVAYKGRKIYEEKVTYLLDVPFASAWDANDGISFLQFGMRSNSNAALTSADGNWNSFNSWISGLCIELNATDGIVIYGGARENKLLHHPLPEGVKNTFNGLTSFSYKVTDIYNEETGALRSIQIEIWINGKPVKLSTDSNAFSIPARRLSDYMTQSGWLNFSMHIMNAEAKESGYAARILGITIDGSEPVQLDATFADDLQQTTMGEAMYTVPGLKAATANGEALTDYEIYLVSNTQDSVPVKVEAGYSFTVSSDYFGGFKISYRYHGFEFASYGVGVAVEVDGIELAGDLFNLYAEVGSPFKVPKVARYIVGDGYVENPTTYTVKVRYDGEPARVLIDVAGDTFTPMERKSFTLCYFVGTTKAGECEVIVEGGDIENLVNLPDFDIVMVKTGDVTVTDGVLKQNAASAFVYGEEQFYDEKITVTFDEIKFGTVWAAPGTWCYGINLRGDRNDGKSFKDDPLFLRDGGPSGDENGLWLQLKVNEGIRLMYGNRDGGLLDTFGSEKNWDQKYMPAGTKLSWQVTDVFGEDGAATGVQVKVWLKAPDAQTETTVFDKFVSVTDPKVKDPDSLFDGYYFVMNTLGSTSQNLCHKISEIKIERTAEAKYKNYDIRYVTSLASPFIVVGKEYTPYPVIVKRKGVTIEEGDEGYQIYARDKDGNEERVTAAFVPAEKYAEGISLVYKCDGHDIMVENGLIPISDVRKTTDGDAFAVIGKPFMAASYGAQLYLNGGMIIIPPEDLDVSLIPEGGGDAIRYTAGMALPEECANGFTVSYVYGIIEIASYEFDNVLTVRTEAQKQTVAVEGSLFEAPALTVEKDGVTAEGEITVKVVCGDETTDYSDAFTVEEKHANGFKIQYFYNGVRVYETAVEVVSVTGTAADKAVSGWQYEALSDVAIADKDGNAVSADEVTLYIVNGADEQEYTGAFEVTEDYAQGFTLEYRYKGVTVHTVVVTAEAITVANEAKASISKETESYTPPALDAKVGETAIPADEIKVYLILGTAERVEVTEAIALNKTYYGGFKLVYVWREHDIFTLSVAFTGLPAITPIEGNDTAIIGGTYTLSALAVTVDGVAVENGDIKKYIVIGDEPADYTGVGEAEASFEVTQEHAGGFKVVYRYGDETIYVLEVRVSEYSLTFESTTENLTATKGFDYKLPVPVVKKGETVVTEGVVQTLVVGETRTQIIDGVLDVLEEYTTVTVEVSMQGVVLGSYTVTAEEDAVATHVLKWSTDVREATVNQAYTVPEVLRYRLNGERKEGVNSEITVRLVYEGGARKPIEITGATYTPVERKNFTLEYFVGETLLDTVDVTIQGGGDIANLLEKVDFNTTAGKSGNLSIDDGVLVQNAASAFVYKEEQFYDEKITVTFDEIKFGSAWAAAGTWVYGINLRGDRKTGTMAENPLFVGGSENGDDNGLWLQMKVNEGIRLTYGNRDTGVKATYADSNKANWDQEFIPAGTELSWQVTDVFENGVATGVQVKVWLKAPDAETETTVFDTFLSANDYPDLFQSYYFVTSTLGSMTDEANYLHSISNIKVERTQKEEN